MAQAGLAAEDEQVAVDACEIFIDLIEAPAPILGPLHPGSGPLVHAGRHQHPGMSWPRERWLCRHDPESSPQLSEVYPKS